MEMQGRTSQPLNVAIVAPSVEGGIKSYLEEVVPRLREKGHRVTFITSPEYEGVIEADVTKSYNCLWPFHKLYKIMPSAVLGIFKVLRDCDVINIYSYALFLTDYLTITRCFHKKPLVVTLCGALNPVAISVTYNLKKLHEICMIKFQKFVDRFIAVSRAEMHEAVSHGISENKVAVIYSAVSADYANIKREKRRAAGKRILYLGRLAGSKNIELLLEAAAHVIKEDNSIKLILAGGDYFGERRKLETLASKLKIQDHVTFTGEVTEEQKRELLSSCDVFVHPSLADTFALTVLEASMAGLPVIAFNAGANPEMIINGKTGILVEPPDAKALMPAILRILHSNDLATKMGSEAREYASSTKFSWEEVVERLEGVYNEVLKVNNRIKSS